MARAAKPKERWGYGSVVYFLLGFIFCLYLVLIQHSSSLTSKVNGHAALVAISLSIAIPEAVIWLVAARGIIRFKEYAMSIKNSRDGDALDIIANSLFGWLAYVVALTVAGMVVSAAHGSHWLRPAVVISNHLPLAIAMVSAIVFCVGARQLNRLVPLTIAPVHARLLTAAALILGALFMLYFRHAEPRLPMVDSIPRFATSLNVLMFTYALPHLVMWLLDMYGFISLNNYAQHIKGAIYKQCFKTLATGVMLVFVCTFLAQIIIVSAATLSKINIWVLLSYALLLLGLYGFILIHRGASNLQHIEKV